MSPPNSSHPRRPTLHVLTLPSSQADSTAQYLPKTLDYYFIMLQSKFCLCPSGHEVASPIIVEAIYAECVPVIISEHYSLPFGDVLRWEAFSVKVEVSEIKRLKEILEGVSDEKYRWLKENLRVVRKHFELNHPAKIKSST